MSVRVASTVKNLVLGPNTKVIYQGFTGRQATLNAKDSIAYGTKVVGGVSPGKAGQHPTLGLPVFNSVKEAKKELEPHASAVFVPATLAAKAIEEAIEAEIPLIVSVAEGMPVHDCLRVSFPSSSLMKGPRNSQNTIRVSPSWTELPGDIKSTFQMSRRSHALQVTSSSTSLIRREFSPGKIAIMSRSGTLCYETVSSTTKAKLGQSTVIGIGGDRLPGTTYIDALEMLADDPTTKGIILIGEVGGKDEFKALEYIKQTKLDQKKPILAYFAGLCAVQNTTFGHAGAIKDRVDRRDDTTMSKIRAYRKDGIKVLDHIGYIGDEMRTLLKTFNRNK